MKALCCFLFLSINVFLSLTNIFVVATTRRHLGPIKETGLLTDFNFNIEINARLVFPNIRLKKAYFALQEWKKEILSDPQSMLKNWDGVDVCSYTGVFCAKAPDDPYLMTVAGIDLNNGDIAGQLVPHLGLLTDLSIFHISSNRFCGAIPSSFSDMKILHELDVSNNRFVGPFPDVVLNMPKLKYLDIRYNNFEGELPSQLFDIDLDAIFLNNNRFSSNIPENIGHSNASVIVLANNEFKGCIPIGITQMAALDEVILTNNQLTGCVPEELGMLENTTVLDLSYNKFVGTIPQSFENLKNVEMIDLRHNELTGTVVEAICTLPKLTNFTFSDNYFSELEPKCDKPVKPEIVFDNRKNCLKDKEDQKEKDVCSPVVNRKIDCESFGCSAKSDSDEESKKRKVPKRTPPPPPPKPSPSPPPTPVPEVPKPSPPPPPPPVQSPPPPVHSPPPPVYSPPPPSPTPPPPAPTQPPPPPPAPTHPPPPPPVPAPPPFDDIVLPPDIGNRYASPPPPMFPGGEERSSPYQTRKDLAGTSPRRSGPRRPRHPLLVIPSRSLSSSPSASSKTRRGPRPQPPHPPPRLLLKLHRSPKSAENIINFKLQFIAAFPFVP
ncbi:hypothetical protein QVD17_27351 [Tagetes erecta]|uniref:Cell wall hydroxyproline-rich glycoprotein n=1 Tax=Tagetes erecta TaxID=13708 RepID=A0AAD8KAT1_TARER|nr:hypothetical protein QVD17_27351 [Tagetes erecta]